MRSDVKDLNGLIETISSKTVSRMIGERYLLSRMAVIVNQYDKTTNTASVIIPTDLNTPTNYKYPNRTGKNELHSGDKVYLVYQTNNISQGWLESNEPFKIPVVEKNTNAKIFYGTCSTTASTVAKVVTCSDFKSTDLVVGAMICVTFSNTNSGAASSLTMEVNETGALPLRCFRNGVVNAIPGNGYLAANQTYLFWYDGTNWVTLLDYNTNNNVAQTVRTNNAEYPLLLAPSGQTATTTTSANFATSATYNPSDGRLTVSRRLLSGSTSSTTENWVQAVSNSGAIYMDSVGNTDGNGDRGIWMGAHGTATSGSWALKVDTNNNVTLNGTATSATNATNAVNAQALNDVSTTNPSSASTYFPIWTANIGSGTAYTPRGNDGLRYLTKEGTTSSDGYGGLRLGNTTNSGTAGNKWGFLDLYPKTGAYYTRVKAADTMTANRTIDFPDNDGTVALTSDIPTSFSLSVDRLWNTNTTTTATWSNFADYSLYIIFVYGIGSSSSILTSGIVPASLFGASSSSTLQYRLADDDSYITLDLYKNGESGAAKKNAGSSGTGIAKIYGVKTVVQ